MFPCLYPALKKKKEKDTDKMRGSHLTLPVILNQKRYIYMFMSLHYMLHSVERTLQVFRGMKKQMQEKRGKVYLI